MSERIFQILDQMNQDDIKDGTSLVSVSNTFISGDKVKEGAKISMGTEYSALMDIVSEKVIPILVLVDAKEYMERSKSD